MRFKSEIGIPAMMIVVIVALAVTAYAKEWIYLVNLQNKIVARLDYSPSVKELEALNLIAVRSASDIPLLQAEYRGGKIVKAPKTQQDQKKEDDILGHESEIRIIQRRSFKNAYDELIGEGMKFNYISNGEFD